MKHNFLQNLKQISWHPIISHLHKKGWTAEKISEAIAQYAMFLFLISLYPHSSLVPSKEVDAVWHSHILQTRQYEKDTQVLLNFVVDHFPYLGLNGETDELNWKADFERTRGLLEQEFGADFLMATDSPENSESARCGDLIEGDRFRPRSDIETKET